MQSRAAQQAARDTRQNNLTGRTVSGVLWMFSGSGAQVVLQIGVTAVLARLLSPQEFGLMSAALVVVNLSTIVADLGVGPALVQFPHLSKKHISGAYLVSLLLGCLIAAVVVVAAPLISRMFRMEDLTSIVRTMSILFLLRGVSVVSESLLQRELRFRRLAAIELISYGVGFGAAGVTFASIFNAGVWSLVAANIAQTAARTGLLLISIQQRPSFSIDLKAIAELSKFGGGVSVSRLANYFALQNDNFVVGRWLGPDALGAYSRAYQLMSMPVRTLGNALDKVLFPAMSAVQDRHDKLAIAFRRCALVNSVVVAPVSALIVVVAPEVVAVLLGDQWSPVVGPIRILAIGMLFRMQDRITAVLARAVGAVYQRAALQVSYAALVFAGAWAGRYWGLNGVALGVLIALVINAVQTSILCFRLVPVTWYSFAYAHVPGLVIATAVGAASYAMASAMRTVDMHPTFVLFATGVVWIIMMVLAIPAVLRRSGKDGQWLSGLAVSRIRQAKIMVGSGAH